MPHITYRLAAGAEVPSVVKFATTYPDGQVVVSLFTSTSGELLLRLEGEHLRQRSLPKLDLTAKQVIEWLSVTRGIPYQRPVAHESSLPSDPSPRYRYGPWSDPVSISIRPVEIHLEDGARLESYLAEEQEDHHLLFSMYGFAAEQESPLAQFVLLYSLIEYIAGGQPAVDHMIWNWDPTEARIPDARRGHYGTTYTKLRNDIGHARRTARADIDRLRPEVNVALPKFRGVVRSAIVADLQSA